MDNIIIKRLNKEEVIDLLDDMFNIINTNMKDIIDTGVNTKDNYINWKDSMIEELGNVNKRWIGAFKNNKLIGYFLYKTDNDILKLDEIQIIKKYQGDGYTFNSLFRMIFNDKDISNDYKVIAYANKNNIKSNDILKHFGFNVLEQKINGTKYITSYKKLKEKLD